MPDYVSRKKLKKKVLDRWENEGGRPAADNNNKQIDEPKKKRKVRKSKLRSRVRSSGII